MSINVLGRPDNATRGQVCTRLFKALDSLSNFDRIVSVPTSAGESWQKSRSVSHCSPERFALPSDALTRISRGSPARSASVINSFRRAGPEKARHHIRSLSGNARPPYTLLAGAVAGHG